MFIIVENDSVILGPVKWNKSKFQNVLEEECEITTTLPNINTDIIIVNENIKIYPVQSTQNPTFNSKIEFLNGPFWEFTETHAISSYVVEPKTIPAVQNQLKNILAQERWTKEILGVTATVQDIEVTVDTNRGTRDIFVQQYLLMGESDTVIWKFPEGWLNLTKSDLGILVATGVSHVKQVFEWEASLVADIDACTTLEELDALEIVTPTSSPFR
jgi:hypothetical protein